MEKIKPRTLSGFMELLPARQMQMERVMQVLRDTYALYGFYPLDTPLIEASEVLLAKGGGETEKQIYRFTKGDSDLSLRFVFNAFNNLLLFIRLCIIFYTFNPQADSSNYFASSSVYVS